ncbi:UNVERIFIED_CONTAM: hypothetical protein Scaly_1434300 [Sesamum calycinum]|uniref:Uncharacterized protein n=1 Tax=Sesamum calycinum TaxID=2727403 RepID=A0AAW2PSV6_9LAMI
MSPTSSTRENKRRKKSFSSPTRTRPAPPTGSFSPPPSATSLVDRELLTEELSQFEALRISPENPNPRSFPYSVKQQCWEKADKIKGRDPDRWRRDPLGNIVFRKLVGCPVASAMTMTTLSLTLSSCREFVFDNAEGGSILEVRVIGNGGLQNGLSLLIGYDQRAFQRRGNDQRP